MKTVGRRIANVALLAASAALLAAEILSVEDAALAERLQCKRAQDTAAVLEKDAGIAARL